MSKKRVPIWLGLILAAVGLLLAFVVGVNAYMRLTAVPLHPDPQEAPVASHWTPPKNWTAAADQARDIARNDLSEQNLAGLSIAVGAGGEVVWAEGFGWADLENKVQVAPSTRFRIGTASKVLTSAAVGLLLESNRLNLDDEIQTAVPEFPKKDWPVTLRQVMGHVAGIRNDGGDEGPLLSARCERPAHALRAFADRPLLFEPGTEYRFSSYGWIVVSAAVEAAAGEPFLAVMRQRIFEPLGLRHTNADSSTDPAPNRATPYFPRFAADPRYGLHLMRPLDYSCYAGASVFVSTPSDLVRFGLAITRGTLLQPATVQVLQTSQRLTSGEETGYGLGWDLGMVTVAGKETRSVGHDGTLLGGPVSSLMTFPEHGIVVAVTSNISYADTPAVALGIARAFAGRGRRPEPR